MEHHSSLIFGIYIYHSKAKGKINQLLDRSLKLDLVKVGKNTTLFDQFIMAAFFGNAILCDNDNSVGTSDCCESVCDDKRGAILGQLS